MPSSASPICKHAWCIVRVRAENCVSPEGGVKWAKQVKTQLAQLQVDTCTGPSFLLRAWLPTQKKKKSSFNNVLFFYFFCRPARHLRGVVARGEVSGYARDMHNDSLACYLEFILL